MTVQANMDHAMQSTADPHLLYWSPSRALNPNVIFRPQFYKPVLKNILLKNTFSYIWKLLFTTIVQKINLPYITTSIVVNL